MIRKQVHRPLYREAVRDAFFIAWHKRRLWLIALFAAVWQTGGVYDVLLRWLFHFQDRAATFTRHPGFLRPGFWSYFSSNGTPVQRGILLGQTIDGLLIGLLLVIAICVLGLLAQGALVYLIGSKQQSTVKDGLAIAGRHFWSLFGTNILFLSIIWVARFILLLPISSAIQQPSLAVVLAGIIAILLFITIAIACITMQLFSLHAIVLEDASAHQAIEKAYTLWRSHWLIALETGALLLILGCAFVGVGFITAGLVSIPLFLALFIGVTLHIPILVFGSLWIGALLFALILFLVAVFSVTFQYATWCRLYERMQKGTARPKIHRIIHHTLHHHLKPRVK